MTEANVNNEAMNNVTATNEAVNNAATKSKEAANNLQIPQETKYGKQENWKYTDKNGKEWDYKFQYPGMRTTMEILDNSRMANGIVSRTTFADLLLEHVVVEPRNLTIDDFDERPGMNDLIDAADEFLGQFND